MSTGPLNNRAQRDFVPELVADAEAQGGTVRRCWEMAVDPAQGWFLSPAVVTGLDDSARLVAEEQFGPALPVLAYDTLDEAIDRVNASEFGLASSIRTADEDRAVGLARRIQAGSTFVNNHGPVRRRPQRTLRRRQAERPRPGAGLPGLAAYTEPHTVSTRHL